MSTTRPPNAAASMQFWNVEGRPTASMHTSKPLTASLPLAERTPVISRTALSSASGLSLRMVPAKPNSRCAYSSFGAATSAIQTSPPSAFAAVAASTPIVPAPTTSTLSPGRTPARCTPW